MKTILLPTDFSQHSERALQFALEIAKHTNAKILLAHSYNVPVFDPNVPSSMLIELCEEERIQVEKNLQKICRQIFEHRTADGKRIRSDYVLEFGLPITEITKVTKDKDIDLIIMGTEESSHMLLSMGSTTLDVINRVQCPVLVVKETTTLKSFEKIYLALDDIKNDIKVINQLIEIAKIFNSEISIIHISRYSTNTEDYESFIKEEEAEEELLSYIRDIYNYKNITLKYHFADQTIEGLIKILNDENLNILSLLKQDRNWLDNLFHKSVIKAVIQKTDMPLLILHKEKNSDYLKS